MGTLCFGRQPDASARAEHHPYEQGYKTVPMPKDALSACPDGPLWSCSLVVALVVEEVLDNIRLQQG